ncbi:MAG: hypothetical protein ABL891_18825 [Burkholderiales bacterium]
MRQITASIPCRPAYLNGFLNKIIARRRIAGSELHCFYLQKQSITPILPRSNWLSVSQLMPRPTWDAANARQGLGHRPNAIEALHFGVSKTCLMFVPETVSG